jgi:hypothetical protein
MNTIAIDRNTINSLFDNQKRVDELFDSIFEDDNFFISSSSYSSQTESRRSSSDGEKRYSSASDDSKDPIFAIRTHNPAYFVLPIVLEVAIIYYIATNLF